MFPSAPFDLSVYREYFSLEDLDLKYNSIWENVLMETSSSPHYPLNSIVCNASNFEEDSPCSLNRSSNELGFEMPQGSEVVHDEEGK